MTEFKARIAGADYVFDCEFIPTRTGFKHQCDVWENGDFKLRTKVCYQNRTWESFEYKTVLGKAMEKLGFTAVQQELAFEQF